MEDKLFELSASEITVEIKDADSGKVYRRELPVEFYENANFLRLRGENLDGSVSELVFYSARGAERLGDLIGKGADHDACRKE